MSVPPVLPSAAEVAAGIVKIIEAGVPTGEICDAYAAFERVYPKAALPGEHQLRAAKILDSSGCVILAVEAYRKALCTPDAPAQALAESRLALGRLLCDSPFAFDEALRVLEELIAAPPVGEWLSEALRLKQKIRAQIDSIYPVDSEGAPIRPASNACRVYAQAPGKVAIPIVGAIVADRLGRRRMDVLGELQRVPGLIARDLTVAQAETLAEALREAGAPVVILDEVLCPPLPPCEIAVALHAGPNDTPIVKLGSGKEWLFDPKAVRLAQFGIVQQNATRWEFLDLYVEFPPGAASDACRVRFAEGRTGFAMWIPLRPDQPRPTFRAMIKRLVHSCGKLPLNHTLDILFSDSDPVHILSPSAAGFDNRSEWLYALVCNGVC